MPVPKSENFDAVIFDWGGVVSTGGTPDEAGKSIAGVLNIEESHARRLIQQYAGRLKRGSIDETQFMQLLCDDLGVELTPEHHDVWPSVDNFRPEAEVMQFVSELQDADYQAGVLSNTFPATANAIRAEGWYDSFDAVATSSDDGYAKPDEEFYQLILSRLGASPERSIFIDDQEYCLEAARALGFVTVRAATPEQFIADTIDLLR